MQCVILIDFFKGPIGYETDLAARKGTEGAEMCVVKTTTKPGNRLICFCHSSVQKKSALILSYNNNITKVLHTFLWSGGMFTKSDRLLGLAAAITLYNIEMGG